MLIFYVQNGLLAFSGGGDGCENDGGGCDGGLDFRLHDAVLLAPRTFKREGVSVSLRVGVV